MLWAKHLKPFTQKSLGPLFVSHSLSPCISLTRCRQKTAARNAFISRLPVPPHSHRTANHKLPLWKLFSRAKRVCRFVQRIWVRVWFLTNNACICLFLSALSLTLVYNPLPNVLCQILYNAKWSMNNWKHYFNRNANSIAQLPNCVRPQSDFLIHANGWT